MATPTNLPAAAVSGDILTAAYVNDLRGAFRILQVVTTTKTDTFTTASATFVDVTDLSVTITPQSTTNKILVFATVSANADSANIYSLNLLRGATNIAQPGAGANKATIQGIQQTAQQTETIIFLDSPASIAAQTYKIQAKTNGGNFYINRASAAADFTSVSSITVLEISA
jgi:hypothetical protein